jgi:LmbE family N-acetylglucosaminyl deacetylase
MLRASLVCAIVLIVPLSAQVPYYSEIQPLDTATDIPANRGAAAVWQLLKKLQTRASLIMITAHPDDEDGGVLTYESRARGTRVALLTLNRGEGGANVMSSESFDNLGLVRTMELLESGRHYGVDQYWTPLTDYGFSKNKEEALGQWSHERVLYDVVRVVRMVRPLVVTSVFVGGPSDGHGNHQVAGRIAADVFRAAGDPSVFADQIKAGLRPWKPLKYYARIPFRRGAGGETLSTDIEIPSGEYGPLLGYSYLQLARQGLGFQKSQTGGPAVPPPGREMSPYHRFGSNVPVSDAETSFFDGVDTSLAGILTLAPAGSAAFLEPRLKSIQALVQEAIEEFDAAGPEGIASLLARGLRETEAAIDATEASALSPGSKYDILHELTVKHAQFNHALLASLGIWISANVATDPLFRIAVPEQELWVNVRVANQSSLPLKLIRTHLEAQESEHWDIKAEAKAASELAPGSHVDVRFRVRVPLTARYTRPHFERPSIGQAWYDVRNDQHRNRSLPPYPLTGWADLEFEGARIRAGQVVQTTQRVTGLGAVSEPLVVGPAISVTVQPRTGIVPLDARSIPLTVVVRSNVKGPAEGRVRLNMPAGWSSTPAEAAFRTASDGEEQSLTFAVNPARMNAQPYEIAAVVEHAGKEYREGFQATGYAGLRPYFLYRSSVHRTSGVDVKVAPDLIIGYITGSGDEVPDSLRNLGLNVNFLSTADLASGDLSRFDAILVGVRAYAVREDLKAHNRRLLEYVKSGGVAIVQYNTPEYDRNFGPYPYVMGNNPEEVTDEASKIEILDPTNPIFTWPNRITSADFDGWIEQRGSKFMASWDQNYTPLLSTYDAGQAPQKGGLLVARYGKGIYVYNAYALYRQLPEGVPGAYRILANLVSLSKHPIQK